MNCLTARPARGLMCERLTRSLRSCISCSQQISSSRVHSFLGSNSRTPCHFAAGTLTRLTCGRVIRGIFFPPLLLHLQQERPGQQSHCHVVLPACPATNLVLHQLHQARFPLLQLELRLDVPPARSHLPHLQQGCDDV